MKRHEDWPLRLAAFIHQAERGAFKWGERDCGLFAADAILAMTGVDVAAQFRGAYSTEGEAMELVGDLRQFAARVAEKHGLDSIHPGLAQRGDVVLLGMPAFGVCLGRYIAATGKNRLIMVPRSKATHAWRVG